MPGKWQSPKFLWLCSVTFRIFTELKNQNNNKWKMYRNIWMAEQRVVRTVDDESGDLFEEVFGTDEELEEAKKRMQKMVEERKVKEQKLSKAEKMEEAGKIQAIGEEKGKVSEESGSSEEEQKIKSEKKEVKTREKEKPKSKGTIKLKFLEDEKGNVFIGRKKSVFEKYKDIGALFIGRVEEEEHKGKRVLLDSLNPHVVFVCGARGSGKSYVLGVIAEELALKNPNVGVIVIDPVGVFWSMRYANREQRELKLLEEWGLKPRGLDNIVVFIPKGMEKDTPEETYDATFSVRPAMLTAQDWCLTFGIERFSPTGLLLEKALQKVEKGYTTLNGERIKGTRDYSLEDIIFCLENDAELNSREKGYKSDSIRALVSRFEAAKSWGIFDTKGTPLSELSREGQLTIIDTSFLDENVTSLVIGLLARRILAARKLATRKEAAKQFMSERELLEIEIPPTWLIIDEAHTLIPSGNVKTAASDALIEYVKQGRRPGCSLVFATQQPAAIDTKVLSQLDIIIVHKLVFNDDIKAVYKRMPTLMPQKYKYASFIRSLPVGVALVGDRREETSRAFIMRIRPRMSQHEGRELEAIGTGIKLTREQVKRLIVSLYWDRLERDRRVRIKEILRTIDVMNKKHGSDVSSTEVFEELENRGAKLLKKKGLIVLEEQTSEKAVLVGEKPEEKKEISEEIASEEKPEQTPEKVEEELMEQKMLEPRGEKELEVLLASFPLICSEKKAYSIAKAHTKKVLGLLPSDEKVVSIKLKHIPVHVVHFNYFTQNNAFRQGTLFINSYTGEFLHFLKEKNSFVESKGLKFFYDLSEKEIAVLNCLVKPLSAEEVSKKVFINENSTKRILHGLVEKGLVKAFKHKGKVLYKLSADFELPKSPLHKMHETLTKMPLVELKSAMIEKERFTESDVRKVLQKIWKKLVVTAIEKLYWPVYEATLVSTKSGTKRILHIDAVTSKLLWF